MLLRVLIYIVVLLCASACNLSADEATPAATVEILLPPTATNTAQYPWSDESATVSGICFEAANDMAQNNRRFLLRSAEDHIGFYDAMDSTGLCLRTVQRVPFDFSTGRALAGLWSAGRGCTAQHEILAYQQDDAARTLSITLQFVTEGDCNYELVRPFWIGFDGSYTLTLTVS
jgi:hypothetical protein